MAQDYHFTIKPLPLRYKKNNPNKSNKRKKQKRQKQKIGHLSPEGNFSQIRSSSCVCFVVSWCGEHALLAQVNIFLKVISKTRNLNFYVSIFLVFLHLSFIYSFLFSRIPYFLAQYIHILKILIVKNNIIEPFISISSFLCYFHLFILFSPGPHRDECIILSLSSSCVARDSEGMKWIFLP